MNTFMFVCLSLARSQREYEPRLLPVAAALHMFRHKPTSEVTTTKQLFNECNYQQTGCSLQR